MDDKRLTKIEDQPKEKVVVVIDDDPNDVEFFMEALSFIYEKKLIKVFNDSEIASKYLTDIDKSMDKDEKMPTLVLVDINMPIVNGFEILKKIKSSNKLKLIPVVMFSTTKRKNDIEKCYELGANAYVIKPIQFNELKEAVEKIFSFWIGCNQTVL